LKDKRVNFAIIKNMPSLTAFLIALIQGSKQSAVAKSVQKVFTGGTAYGLEGRAKTCGRRLFK